MTETGNRGRVLVVDDDAALAEMLTIVLRNEGFEPKVCPTGDQALSDFRGFRPDVVLLDLMLPGKDGIDVCKELRAESGASRSPGRRRCRSATSASTSPGTG